MDGAAQYVKNYNMEVSWQEELGQNVASAKDGETVYQIWLEDNESQDARIRLIRANELKGIAFWKLGMDGSSVWDVIGKYYAAPDAEPVTAGAAEED